MKKIKLIWGNWLKKIKNSNFMKLLKSKTIIKELEDKIGDLGKEKQQLIDELRVLNLEKDKLESEALRIPSLEQILEASDKSIKEKIQENKKLDKERLKLEAKVFEQEQELARVKIQMEEYETQIEDLKSDRYLIKKLPADRTKSKIKTKISNPTRSSVVKYMREEHED